MELRHYQAAVIESARRALTTKGSVVLQMPTGAGKTRVASAMIAEGDETTWFICHRQEIEKQTAKAFAAAGIDFGIVSPRAEPDYSKPVQIVSVDTLARRMTDLPLPTTVFWDECHHVAAKSWARIREQLAGAKHIGLTATPERLDGKGLSEWFAELVVGPSTRELIDDGWLSDFRYFAPSEPDLAGARLQAGDYRKDDLDKAMNMPVLIGDAIAEYREKASGKRALVFAASVDASKALVNRFNAEGIAAAHVDGNTPDDMRDAAVKALAAGRINVLSNVEVFTEGFDLPAIDAVILLRPTKSLALFLQMIGRVLRKADGKGEALIFDHAGLWLDHGWFDAPLEWSLNGGAREQRIASMGDGRLRRCPQCKEVRETRIETCRCGYEFQAGREIGEYDGQLYELRSDVPSGCATITEFANMVGFSASAAHKWLQRGLPNNGRHPIIKDGLAWVSVNVRAIAHGSESQNQFSKRMSVASGTITDWIKRGLPVDESKAVRVDAALRWVEENIRVIADGHETLSAFARRRGVKPDEIRAFVRKGMPYDAHKGVPIRDAAHWMDEYREPQIPTGCIRKTQFAKINGINIASIYRWMDLGLPHVDGYPLAKEGAEWVKNNVARPVDDNHESAANFSRRLGRKYQGFVKDLKSKGLPADDFGRVHIQRGLEWVRDNTNIVIPPEAWPQANDNDAPTKRAA